jgi:pilus assembly protein Flp/PilA
MKAIRTMLRSLCHSERGATAIEYGLIVAMIAVACIAGMRSLGGGSGGMWTQISDKFTNATTQQP